MWVHIIHAWQNTVILYLLVVGLLLNPHCRTCLLVWERGRNGGREGNSDGREKHPSVASCMCPNPTTTATVAHAPTRNQELNLQPFGPQDNIPTNWATPTRALLLVLNSVANSIFRKKHRIPFYSFFTWDWITDKLHILQSLEDKLTNSREASLLLGAVLPLSPFCSSQSSPLLLGLFGIITNFPRQD